MDTYAVTTRENLRSLCIAHNWFTGGTNEQYEKMFYANENGFLLSDVAIIIWVCSDDWSYHDILSILTDERRAFLHMTHQA